MEHLSPYKTIPRSLTYISNSIKSQNIKSQNIKYMNKNIFLQYSIIVESLQSGLPPKYLSFEEKEVMSIHEGPYWYDNWD